MINTNEIAALIDKAKEERALKEIENKKLTQSSVKNSFATGLSLSEEDALRDRYLVVGVFLLVYLMIRIY